jgi:hypothetical protein
MVVFAVHQCTLCTVPLKVRIISYLKSFQKYSIIWLIINREAAN